MKSVQSQTLQTQSFTISGLPFPLMPRLNLVGCKITELSVKTEQASFEDDLQFYRENFPRFLSEYRGKYIALLKRQVVDSDTDFSKLAERVYAKFGYRDIFMPKVEEPRVIDMPSPMVEHRR